MRWRISILSATFNQTRIIATPTTHFQSLFASMSIIHKSTVTDVESDGLIHSRMHFHESHTPLKRDVIDLYYVHFDSDLIINSREQCFELSWSQWNISTPIWCFISSLVWFPLPSKKTLSIILKPKEYQKIDTQSSWVKRIQSTPSPSFRSSVKLFTDVNSTESNGVPQSTKIHTNANWFDHKTINKCRIATTASPQLLKGTVHPVKTSGLPSQIWPGFYLG